MITESNKSRSTRINSAILFSSNKKRIDPNEINTYKNILRFENKSKIAVCSLYTSKIESFATHTTINFQDYCDRNNYDFICSNASLDLDRPLQWSKIKILQQNLKDYEWLMWIDADAAIMNKDIKIESIIDNNYNIIIAREDCRDKIIINTGVFLIKNTEWSKNFLTSWYNLKGFIRKGWYDQSAFIHLYNSKIDIKNNVKIIKQKLINSFNDSFTKGDFIIHFPGNANKNLLKQLSYYDKDSNNVDLNIIN